jgi:hypothetical protein
MRRTRLNRFLVTILALSLTVVCTAAATRSASALTVTRTGTSARWDTGSSYGDPDSPTGSGLSSGTGGGIMPHTRLQQTDNRTAGGGATSKMGWLDTVRILMAQWRVFFVR